MDILAAIVAIIIIISVIVLALAPFAIGGLFVSEDVATTKSKSRWE